MNAGLGIRPAAIPAWLELHRAIAAAGPTPCSANPDSWTDYRDEETTAAAADLCQGWCPVLALCHAFATTNRETSGVWAGRNRTPKRGRPAAETQEST